MENLPINEESEVIYSDEDLLKFKSEKSIIKLKAFLKESFETLLLALILVLIINTISTRIRVEGFSMESSLHDNNYILVSKLTYKFNEVERGDVIVFEYPLAPDEDFIKRVIGLPGDTIKIENGIVYLNGLILQEDYIKAISFRDQPLIEVPVDMVFVMGDNRNNSSDSRSWGPLPTENIIGKSVFVYWPLSDIGVIDYSEIN